MISGSQYNCRVLLDGTQLLVNPTKMPSLVMVQDLHRYLPSVEVSLLDSDGALAHVWPLDHARRLRVEFGYPVQGALLGVAPEQQVANAFEFDVYRRRPSHDGTTTGLITMNGLYHSHGLFAPDRSRVLSGRVLDSLKSLAVEMDIPNCDVDGSLNMTRDLIQPSWSNVEFLNWHRQHLDGASGEAGFFCFVKARQSQPVFTFRSYNSFWQAPVAYKFLVGSEMHGEWLPAFQTEVVDNYRMLGAFSGRRQDRSWFDWENGVFRQAGDALENMPSLTPWFAVHQQDQATGITVQTTGRSNPVDGNFLGLARGLYWNKLLALSKMWITSWGIPNAAPGDLVQLVFSASLPGARMEYFQYSGYWLIERVVHVLGETFQSKLLLTRNGMDSCINENLVEATKVKKDGGG